MLELTRDVVKKFNQVYKKDVLSLPEGLYPSIEYNVPGIDGQKMSKSLGNAIYLGDQEESVIKKIKKMKSDENRKSLQDPGDPSNSISFTYLDLFDPEKGEVEKLKEQYRRGGLPDKVVKERLTEVLLAFLEPIRKRREVFYNDRAQVEKVLAEGTCVAREKASATLAKVKEAMGIYYPEYEKN